MESQLQWHAEMHGVKEATRGKEGAQLLQVAAERDPRLTFKTAHKPSTKENSASASFSSIGPSWAALFFLILKRASENFL